MEYWDIYDINKKKTGRTTPRLGCKLNQGEYHIVVNAIIINSQGKILVSKRADYKPHGLMWEMSGGSITVGETSIEGMIREVKEELGIQLEEKEGVLFKTVRRDDPPADFKDLWLFKKDVDLRDITFPDGEAVDAKWVTIDEFESMVENKEIIGTRDFGREDYEKIIKEF
ncbi:MAG: NUDIX domain-containing protein [Clostridia bacterium]|nr:NUDIX domain-containing protein [Clostridia bacterium]